MKFTVSRNAMLEALQIVQGSIGKKQSIPILGHVLLQEIDNKLMLSATDTEITTTVPLSADIKDGSPITVPVRKFLDICKTLSDESDLEFLLEDGKALLKSGRNRFTLSTLPANEFPETDTITDSKKVEISQDQLKQLIQLTQFAMAQNDVRFFLNGTLFELSDDKIRLVATDGHRLAIAEQGGLENQLDESVQAIVPRKAISEIQRLLGTDEESISVEIAANNLRVHMGNVSLITRLVESRFPDYEGVIPDIESCEYRVRFDVDELKRGLSAASVLANDKFRTIKLKFSKNTLTIEANNPEQEHAVVQLGIEYSGKEEEIGFNVAYLFDALSAITSNELDFCFTDANSSTVVLPVGSDFYKFIVMPLRL